MSHSSETFDSLRQHQSSIDTVSLLEISQQIDQASLANQGIAGVFLSPSHYGENITSMCHHLQVFRMGSRDKIQVLILAKQESCWLDQLPSPGIRCALSNRRFDGIRGSQHRLPFRIHQDEKSTAEGFKILKTEPL